MKTNPNDLIQPVKSDKIRVGGGDVYGGGLTKREYFSAMAMQGILSGDIIINDHLNQSPKWSAEYALQCADALIVELNKEAKDV